MLSDTDAPAGEIESPDKNPWYLNAMPEEPEDKFAEIERKLRDNLRAASEPVDPEESEKTSFELPEPPSDDEIERRMDEMRRRVSGAGKSAFPEPPDFNVNRPSMMRKRQEDEHGYRGLGIGLTAAYALVGMMILGFVVGWLIDGRTTGAATAFGGLLGTVLGIGFVLWLINRDS